MVLNIGQKILLARKEKKLSQRRLAEELGVGIQTIVRWESGRTSPTADQLEKIAQFLKKPISYFFNSAESRTPTTSIHRIPVVSWVHANNFQDIIDNYPPGYAEEWIYTTIPGKNIFALRVINDCMEPEFREGDIIVVKPQVEIYSGDYVVVADRESNKATFKQFKQYGRKKILHPLNPKYEDIELDGNKQYTIVGKVIEKIKRYK